MYLVKGMVLAEVHYGGHSAEKSGLLAKVCQNLEKAGLAYVKLGGVVPNPRLGKVHEGKDVCMEAIPLACILTISATGSACFWYRASKRCAKNCSHGYRSHGSDLQSS